MIAVTISVAWTTELDSCLALALHAPGLTIPILLRNANIYEPHCYRHLISAIRVTGEDAGVWSARTGYAVIRTMQEGDISVFSSGKYIDRIVFENDEAKFAEKSVCERP